MGGRREALIRHAYAAWNSDDLDSLTALVHPDVEWRSSGAFPGLEPVYRGPAGVREWWRTIKEPFETFTLEAESIREEGDVVVTLVNFRAVGKESGAEVKLPFAHVFWFEDDVIVRYCSFQTADDALAAAGLSGA